MDIDTFEEVVSASRVNWRRPSRHEEVILEGEFRAEYKPYIECPRCSEWKLAARIHKKRHKESKGFLRGSTTEWRVADRWWECQNCAGTFDVMPADESADNAGREGVESGDGGSGNDAGEVTEGGRSDDPASYELDFIHQSGTSSAQPPVEGGEKGIVRSGNVVRVPASSAKFRLPLENDLAKNAEVRIRTRGEDVYCVALE